MTQVDKNVPIPNAQTTEEYPWKEMEVGDSFLHRSKVRSTVGPMCSKAGKKYGRKFVYRREGEGFRVWRVE